jgi:RND family efflux transporter MFP subunit
MKNRKKKPASKRKRIIAGSTVLALVAAGATLFLVLRNRDRAPVVQAVAVTTGDFIREVSANGEITSGKSVAFYSPVTAIVESIPVKVGDHVTEGDPILLLDKESVENNLIGAEIALANARMGVQGELLSLRTAWTSAFTAHDQAARDLKRAEELHRIGSISDEELRQKREALVLAESSLDSARQKLNFREGRPLSDTREGPFLSDAEIVDRSPEVRKAEIERNNAAKALFDYRITADMTGIVTDLPIEEGGVVSPGTLLARIQNDRSLKVIVNVDEVDLSYVALGQRVVITSDSFIGRELPGVVSEIAPTIRKVGDSRVCAIEVEILENPGGIARIGAGASIFITVEEKKGVPAIPVESYFPENGSKWVFVLERGEGDRAIVRRREIETGILGIETIEVTSGLQPGEEILDRRDPAIADGMTVRLLPGPDAKGPGGTHTSQGDGTAQSGDSK